MAKLQILSLIDNPVLKLQPFKFRSILPKVKKNHFFTFQIQIKFICVCIISSFQLSWIKDIKLLHKNNLFTISHLWFLKYWPLNFAHVFKKLIFEGQYYYHSWRYHILDMLFFNCIKIISSPLSHFSFELDLVAEICLNKLWYAAMWCLTTPNSSGQHPSGVATVDAKNHTRFRGHS